MKTISLILAALLGAQVAVAAEIPATTKDGKKVLLNDNGT